MWKILKRAGVVIGPLMFFGSLALAARDIAELGLSWIWWAVIGGGIFFLSGFAIIYGQHKDNIRLQEHSHDKATRREIREILGEFIKGGEQIKRRCYNEKQKAPEEESLNWARGVAKYLTARLGSDYEASFYNSDGLPLGVSTIQSAEHRRIESFIRCRIARLQQFLAELRD